tara:strand:+ start:94 stop:366 length:273 start_codon:yes stop_codon:yes gene_type:complete
MNKVNFIPAENKVLIRLIKKEKSASGLILDKAVEDNIATQNGTIHASSTDGYTEGDEILFNQFAALEISLGKQGKYLLASKEAILGKITK